MVPLLTALRMTVDVVSTSGSAANSLIVQPGPFGDVRRLRTISCVLAPVVHHASERGDVAVDHDISSVRLPTILLTVFMTKYS